MAANAKNSRKAPKASNSKKARTIPASLRDAFQQLSDEDRRRVVNVAVQFAHPQRYTPPAAEPDINEASFATLVAEWTEEEELAKLRPERAREMVRDGLRDVYETSLAVSVHAGLLRALDEEKLSERYVSHQIASEICPKAIHQYANRLTLAIDTLRELLKAMGACPSTSNREQEDVSQPEEQTG